MTTLNVSLTVVKYALPILRGGTAKLPAIKVGETSLEEIARQTSNEVCALLTYMRLEGTQEVDGLTINIASDEYNKTTVYIGGTVYPTDEHTGVIITSTGDREWYFGQQIIEDPFANNRFPDSLPANNPKHHRGVDIKEALERWG